VLRMKAATDALPWTSGIAAALIIAAGDAK
jgi:hypothetical protein